MDVFGKDFEFDGISSNIYGVALCSFESVDTDRKTGISYTVQSGDITPYRPIPNYYNKKYNEPLSFRIVLCKSCGDTEYFTIDEQKSIVRWLTSPVDYRKLKIIDFYDEAEPYHCGTEYFCICTNYGETVINSLIGMYFDFQCNAPYAFYEEQVTKFDTSVSSIVLINNYSDELEEDYYPHIKLKASATGQIEISNINFPNETMVLSVKNGQILYIDNKNCDISDNMDLFNYSTDTNLVWIKLKFGKNEITINGNCTGEIRCRYPRKVGI